MSSAIDLRIDAAGERHRVDDVLGETHLMVWILVVFKLDLDEPHDGVKVRVDVADPAVPHRHVGVLDVESTCACGG
jgi:hypothetical protein